MEEKQRILLCEDDENLGMLLREYLQAKGYYAELCPDGDAGYKAFLKGKFDLCVLDVMMPIKDGFTLAQEIRAVNPEIPIIFLTAKSLKEDILEGFKIGADDYITKPYTIRNVIARVKSVLRRTSTHRNNESAPTEKPNRITVDGLCLDLEFKRCTVDGKEVKLRACVKCGAIIEAAPKKAAKKTTRRSSKKAVEAAPAAEVETPAAE